MTAELWIVRLCLVNTYCSRPDKPPPQPEPGRERAGPYAVLSTPQDTHPPNISVLCLLAGATLTIQDSYFSNTSVSLAGSALHVEGAKSLALRRDNFTLGHVSQTLRSPCAPG